MIEGEGIESIDAFTQVNHKINLVLKIAGIMRLNFKFWSTTKLLSNIKKVKLFAWKIKNLIYYMNEYLLLM